MALRGRTNRQVFINKDRKTTPRELVDIKKENTLQLKIIISIYSHLGCCTFFFFLDFYSALISDRRRRDCKLPPPPPRSSARLSSVWGWGRAVLISWPGLPLRCALAENTRISMRLGAGQTPGPASLTSRITRSEALPAGLHSPRHHLSWYSTRLHGGGVDTQRRGDEAEPLHNTHT